MCGAPLVVRCGGKEVLNVAVANVTNGNRGPYDSLFRFAPLGTLLSRAGV